MTTIDSIIHIDYSYTTEGIIDLDLVQQDAVCKAKEEAKKISYAFSIIKSILTKNNWERYSEKNLKKAMIANHLATVNRKSKIFDDNHVPVINLSDSEYDSFIEYADKAIAFGKHFNHLKSGSGKSGGLQLPNNFDLISQKSKFKYAK